MAGSRERVVEFAVKARDEYSTVLKNLERQQNKLSAAAKAANRRAVVGAAQGDVDAALANYKRLTSEVDRYNKVLADGRRNFTLADAELEELASTIKLTRDRAREAADAYQQKRAALAQLTGTTNSGIAALTRLTVATRQGVTAGIEQSAAVAGEVTQLKKLETGSRTAATAQGLLKKQTDITTVSLLRQRSAGNIKGEGQAVAAFGLKPYQLTNLGYQVNDVVSGLAMGQRPIQILAQQAGQFVQIWPGMMSVLARSIPQIALFTAVLTPFIVAASRLHTFNESIRIFTQQLTLSADGAQYSAEELAKLTDKMDKFGYSTKNARATLLQFVSAGISQKNFEPLARMAQDLSNFSGEKIEDAGKRLSEAFSGSVDGVIKLDSELGFLSAEQLKSIKVMRDSGHSADALSFAQAVLQGKLAATREETGPWGDAVNDLSKAWGNLVTTIQDSGVITLGAVALKSLGFAAKNAAALIKGASNVLDHGSVFDQGTPTAQLQNQLAAIQQSIAIEKALRSSGMSSGSAGMSGEDTLKNLEDQQQALALMLASRREEVTAIKEGTEAQQASADETERAKKARDAVQEVLDKQISDLDREARQVSETARQRYIENEYLKAKNAALEKAKSLNQDILGLTEQQAKAVRDAAAVSYDKAHPNYEAQYTAQRNSPDGAQMRELVAGVATIADRLHLSAKDLLTAISYETKGTFNPSIRGGAGNKYVGLFQASPDVQAKYGIDQNSSITKQLEAMAKYLVDAGVKAGDGLLQIYAAINAGSAKKTGASDEKNGGAPGTVLDKVSEQMGDHEAKAQALLAAYAGIAEQAKKTAEYEKDFKERTDAAQRQLDLKTQETREAAIAQAIGAEEARAKKQGVELTKQQLDLIRQTTGALFDRAHADDQVNSLVKQRSALFESLQIAQQVGDQAKVADLIPKIQDVEKQLESAIPAAIAFWQAIGGATADQEIAHLQQLQDTLGKTIQAIDKKFLPTAIDLNERLADVGANAFDKMAQAIANGENAAQAFFDALRQGLADFLIEIGKAIIKQAIFNAISGGSAAGGSGGIGGSIVSAIASIFHGGGVVGRSAAPMRMVNPAIFANAQRFHSGGIMGLKPNEVPVIAEVGEEMLTSSDPRHSRNGGGRGGAVNVKNVNVFDASEVLEAALATTAGERVIVNWISRNPAKVNLALSS